MVSDNLLSSSVAHVESDVEGDCVTARGGIENNGTIQLKGCFWILPVQGHILPVQGQRGLEEFQGCVLEVHQYHMGVTFAFGLLEKFTFLMHLQ